MDRTRSAPDAAPATRSTAVDRACAAGLVVAVMAPLAVLGANTAFLATGAAVLHLVTALLIVWALGREAPAHLWLLLAGPAALLAAAVVWALQGLAVAPRADWSEPLRALAGAQWASLAPDMTRVEAGKLIGLGGLGLAATLVGLSPARLRFCASLFVAAGALYALAVLGLHQHDPLTVFGVAKGSHAGRFTASLLNPNAAGCVFAMLCIVAVGLLSGELSRLRAGRQRLELIVVLAIAAFLFMGACALTQSRSALAVALAGVGAVVALRRSVWAPRRAIHGRLRIGWILAAVVGWAVVGAGAGAVHRLNTLQMAAEARLDAYGHVADLAGQAPLEGYGVGAFASAALHGLTPEEGRDMADFRAAHNGPLQLVFEGGWPYAALVLGALSMWALAGLRGAAPAGARSVRLGFGLAAAAAGLCNMVDIALQVPALAAFAAVGLGLWVGAGCAETAPARRGSAVRPAGQAA